MNNTGNVYIDYDVYSVRIWNSFLITKRKEMKEYVNRIKNYSLCPDCVRFRSTRSLIREWEAHNFLYRIGYEVQRTMHVDFNDEPVTRRLGYAFLSILYRLGL